MDTWVPVMSQSHITQYRNDGFTVVKGLFSDSEVNFLRQHYDDLNLSDDNDVNLSHPHRLDEVSLQWVTDDRLNKCITGLLGREPCVAHTMVYFKPPGTLGHGLHQDQYFLRVNPGTCIAAWLALDDADEENGCLRIVPGSHTLPLLCATDDDKIDLELPQGHSVIPLSVRAGGVIFFHGQLVHGSGPNLSKDRFRRSLIGHYIATDSKQVYDWYHPVLRMDGTEVNISAGDVGGACGTWVDKGGDSVVEMRPETDPIRNTARTRV